MGMFLKSVSKHILFISLLASPYAFAQVILGPNPAREAIYSFDSRTDLVPVEEAKVLEKFHQSYLNRFGRVKNILEMHKVNSELYKPTAYPERLPIADEKLEKVMVNVKADGARILVLLEKKRFTVELKRVQVLKAAPHSWVYTFEINGKTLVLNEDDGKRDQKFMRAADAPAKQSNVMFRLMFENAFAEEGKPQEKSALWGTTKSLVAGFFAFAIDMGGTVGGLAGGQMRKMLLGSMTPGQLDQMCILLTAPLATAKALDSCKEAKKNAKEAKAAAQATTKVGAAVSEQATKMKTVAKEIMTSPIAKMKGNITGLAEVASKSVTVGKAGLKGGMKLAFAASGGPITTAIVVGAEVFSAGMAFVGNVCPNNSTVIAGIQKACDAGKDPTKYLMKQGKGMIAEAAQ